MYVTAPNEIFALDAGSGRQIWHFKRARTQGVAQGWANRGAAVAGDRVFLATDNAHVIALNRWTGALLWDTQLADWRQNYSASSAPLPAGNLVISGVAGGEHGANGFVAAHDQETGKEIWRFWAVPRPGEPGSETWKGTGPGRSPRRARPGSPAATIPRSISSTGRSAIRARSTTATIARATISMRTASLALDRTTGRLKWHYQFTPHDLWDWDATQTSVVVDGDWQGRAAQAAAARQPQRLLLRLRSRRRHAAAREAVRPQSHLGERHRRGRPSDQAAGTGAGRRRHQGVPVAGRRDQLVLPVLQPGTGLYYVQTFEKCSIYTKTDGGEWEAGQAVPRRLAAHRAGSGSAAHPQGHRHPHRRDQAGSCRSRGPPTPGAARCPPPRVW